MAAFRIRLQKVIGTGTTLDTARLRYLLGDYFNVDPKNVHAYVIGEHGDSEMVPWSQAFVGTKSIMSIVENNPDRFKLTDLDEIAKDVTGAAQKIIEAKKATYYGIGMALVRIVKAIFGDEKSVLTVSSMFRGEYDINGVYAGIPSIIGRDGVREIVTLDITAEEEKKLKESCELLKNASEGIKI